jgi:hypothetical protein
MARFAGGKGLIPVSAERTVHPCFFYKEILLHEFLFVEHRDGFLGFPPCGHFDKGKTPHLTGLMVSQDLDRRHLSCPGKMGFEICFGGLVRKIAYIYFRIHFSSFILGYVQDGKIRKPGRKKDPGDSYPPGGEGLF